MNVRARLLSSSIAAAVLALAACSGSSDGGPIPEPSGGPSPGGGVGAPPGGGDTSAPPGSSSGGAAPGAGTDGGAADGAVPEGNIDDVLRGIPGITVVKEVTDRVPPGYRRFDLTIEQPMNHADPGGKRFAQRLSLLHKDRAAPFVLATSGYGLSTGSSELTRLFGANQLQVEHRYFTPSIPTEADWAYLDIRQSAADFHRIAEALRPVYTGKWVNTGASKGGMTSLYHRRFFPADLDGTVAYVAPLVYGTADPRFVSFVDSVGGDTYAACREALKTLQRAVLTRRVEVEGRMEGTYDSLGSKEIALEHAVLEMPFAFWQYTNPANPTRGCGAIPAADAPIATLYGFFAAVAQLNLYADGGFAYFSPYYYQAATELGAPGVGDAHLTGLLKHRATYAPSSYVPKTIPVTFKPESMVDVQAWVRESGQSLMFIYGEYDPWTAGPVELGAAKDSFVFTAPGANHGAKLSSLTSADRDTAIAALERWLAAKVVANPLRALRPIADDEPEIRGRL